VNATIHIRRASAADLAALLEIENESFSEPWSANALAAELAEPGARLDVAVAASGTLAGYASWRLLPGEGELLKVAVRPSARRQRIALRLIEHGLDELRSAGAVSAYLEVRETNRGAIALYERLGFESAGRRPSYYSDGTPALLLCRRLAPG